MLFWSFHGLIPAKVWDIVRKNKDDTLVGVA